MTHVKIIEGVPWRKYRVRYRMSNGRRRSMTRWSPGFPWVRMEIARELDETIGIENIAPRSVTIREAT